MQHYEIGGIVFIVVAIVHVASAIAVRNSADAYRSKVADRTLMLPTWLWILAALMGGAFIAGLFWIMHFSMLNPLTTRPAEPQAVQPKGSAA